jgi:site-specific DNA-cytosine methylase
VPHRTQGFPDEYEFRAAKKDQVKQIGNACTPNTAMALIMECLNADTTAKLRAA